MITNTNRTIFRRKSEMGRVWKINENNLDEFGRDKPGTEKQYLDLKELNKRTGIALYEVSAVAAAWLL